MPNKEDEQHDGGDVDDDQSVCSSDSSRPRNVFSKQDLMAIAVRNCETMLESVLPHVECEEDLKQVLWLLDVPSATLPTKLYSFTRQLDPKKRFYSYLKLKKEFETLRLAPIYASKRDARRKAHSLVESERRRVDDLEILETS